jgi:dipeptidyl aminopeptidase/acylaminoacyl peptidase
MASGSFLKTVKLWEVATGKQRAALQGHDNIVYPVAFSPDGKTLASGSVDRTVKLWDVATGKERASLLGHADIVYSVAFSPDGKTLASGSWDRTVKLWDVATGKERASLHGHTGQVHSVAFSPDGKTLALGSSDKTVRLWDIPASNQTDKRGEPAPSTTLSAQDLDSLWTTLAGDDAAKAFKAIAKLTESHQQAISLLKVKVRPAAPEPNIQQINRLITELDSNEFAVRQKAVEELEKLGEQAAPALRKKLVEKPSLEVRQRTEQLLTKVEALTPESLRAVRAIEVLEHIGSSEAKNVLETLATGADGSRMTTEAKASLQRLNKRVATNN